MTRLFFNDNAIELNTAMRDVEAIHPITKELSIWWARSYQFASGVFMIGVPSAIFYDAITKNNTTKRYLAAIWEKLQNIHTILHELVCEVKKLRTDTK